jgi:hypothetical protein
MAITPNAPKGTRGNNCKPSRLKRMPPPCVRQAAGSARREEPGGKNPAGTQAQQVLPHHHSSQQPTEALTAAIQSWLCSLQHEMCRVGVDFALATECNPQRSGVWFILFAGSAEAHDSLDDVNVHHPQKWPHSPKGHYIS